MSIILSCLISFTGTILALIVLLIRGGEMWVETIVILIGLMGVIGAVLVTFIQLKRDGETIDKIRDETSKIDLIDRTTFRNDEKVNNILDKVTCDLIPSMEKNKFDTHENSEKLTVIVEKLKNIQMTQDFCGQDAVRLSQETKDKLK